MAIKVAQGIGKCLIEPIERFFAEESDGDVGDLKAMRRAKAAVALVLAAMCLAMVAGCADVGDPARFVRYETLPDGRQAALIEWRTVAAGPQERALVRFEGLEAGDIVMVRRVGRDWDQPQWTPELVVVSAPTR